jgi:non-specific serine/threonine protein kinase/serine/threonine-protein kinase
MEKAPAWEKVKQIFCSALELDPNKRAAFLDEACAEDQALLAEVQSLLAAHHDPESLLDNPWQGRLQAEMTVPLAIGPYQLVRKLGAGGMGEVWLAQQTTPVKRQVALKLIRSSEHGGTVLQRFKWERQSLALMDHPAIAKVLEAGSTPTGQPYLVMEYVPGLPITEYCDQKKLTVRERLELFIRTCEGVQHAHQKAILHRDLKPANILVVEVDGRPMPRIIDFGLAKMTAPLLDEHTILQTQAGTFLGTPGYMSPEQADGGTEDVDTRTDVYSLGVVLYVLLTGCLPFEAKKTPVHEFLRRLREQDPPKPSTRIETEKATTTSTASARGTDPGQLRTLLTGDLDWIAMKALEKDRNRRYGTPSELAADIRRYLNNEPIAARPASVVYQLRKYVRRHRIGVAFATVTLLLLIGFGIVQERQIQRITRERDRADRVSNFMTQMFKVSDPSEARGNSITAREILDRASVEIDSGLKADPEIQAEMMDVMGTVYSNLGLYPRAESLVKGAVEIHSRLQGREDRSTLQSLTQLGQILGDEGHYDEAEKLQREVLEKQLHLLGQDDKASLRTMNTLAWSLVRQSRYDEAEQVQRRALEIARRVLGAEHPLTLQALRQLAAVRTQQGHYVEAEQMERELLEMRSRVLGPEHPETLIMMNNIGCTLQREGRFEEAEKMHRATLEILRRVMGAEHPYTLQSMSNLGRALIEVHRYPEAAKLLEDTWKRQTRMLGANHPDTAWSLYAFKFAEAHGNPRALASEELSRAIARGLPTSDDIGLSADSDLKPVYADEGVKALLASAKAQVDGRQ